MLPDLRSDPERDLALSLRYGARAVVLVPLPSSRIAVFTPDHELWQIITNLGELDLVGLCDEFAARDREISERIRRRYESAHSPAPSSLAPSSLSSDKSLDELDL